MSNEAEKGPKEDRVEILRPKDQNGEVIAWAPRSLVEPFFRMDEVDRTCSLFAGIPGVEMEVRAESGFTVRAPAYNDINAVAGAIKFGFHKLGLRTRISTALR